MHVLFVCTGNTCRSPMAEALFRQSYPNTPVSSAGLSVFSPGPASENAILAMQKQGIDISAHRSRQISDADIESCDVILTMTEAHKSVLIKLFPEAAHKTFTLSEYAGKRGDIPDPFGKSAADYEKTAAVIGSLIGEIRI